MRTNIQMSLFWSTQKKRRSTIGSKVSKLVPGRFDIDPGFQGTQHVKLVGNPQVSTCEKLCKVLSCVDPSVPKLKSVKFEVKFHDNHD